MYFSLKIFMLLICSIPETSGARFSGFCSRSLKGKRSDNACCPPDEANWMAFEIVLLPVPLGANLIFSLPSSMVSCADEMLLQFLTLISMTPSFHYWLYLSHSNLAVHQHWKKPITKTNKL